MSDLRVGVLGAGLIAGVHARTYAATPGARVVAVADPVIAKAEQLAAQVGARAVKDLNELLETGVDVVSVCTPPSSHAPLTTQALQAGLHVLGEKPLARSLDEAHLIVEAARRAPGVLMVGHVSRFEPDHQRAKEVVESGELGEVQMMSHSMTTSLPGWSEGGWLANPELSGGPLVDLAVHSFDYLSWLSASAPVRVHAVGSDSPAGPETYALATVRYQSGAMALVETSWAHPTSYGFKLRVEIIGTRGRLAWSYDEINGGALYVRDGDTTWFDPLGDRGYRAEIATFVKTVQAGSASPVPAEEGYRALRTALAAVESVRTGETIDLTSWRMR
ncbi:MAG: Gfo/Idh/MocA family protein [Nocardioidaceae bacterium]